MNKMKGRFVTTIFLAACAFFSVVAFGAEPSGAPRKKLIELGWDIPTTDYLREHYREMESNAPFDGVVYDLTARNDAGQLCSSQSLFTPERWNREDFQSCVDDLNACDFQRYRENFIRVNFHPAGFDWTDDDAWSAVSEKVGICAYVARETRGGICFDFESYGATLFRWDSKSSLSFNETRALARKRGAQFCKAIVDEYPDVTILCLWMNSVNYAAGRAERPEDVLRGSYYGLLPSFIDGLLDEASSETRFVEGCESGYYMDGALEYMRASLEAISVNGPAMALVSPENRAKYRLQTTSGFGFYLDMYSNPEGSIYYRGPRTGETRFDRLRANLTAAFDAAEEYVWVYGEKKRWWAPPNGGEWESWEEALPGLTALIFELSDPQGAYASIKERLESSGAKNLIVNGRFKDKTDVNAFANWGTWRREDSHGQFLEVDGVAAIKGDLNACYIQPCEVKPGKKYLISGKIGVEGDVVGSLIARWQDSSHRWVSEQQDIRIGRPEQGAPDASGRVEATGVATVPEGASFLVVLLSASAESDDAVATFDDIKVYEIE